MAVSDRQMPQKLLMSGRRGVERREEERGRVRGRRANGQNEEES